MEVIIPIFAGVLVNIIDIKYSGIPISDVDKLTQFFLNKFGTGDRELLCIIILIGILVILMACLSLLCGYLSGKHCAKASAGFAKNIREAQFYNIQKFSFSNIDKFSMSSLLTRLSSDIMHVRMTFQMVIRTAVRSPLMLILSLISTLTISPKLSLIFLLIVPILGIGLIIISTLAHPIFEKVFYKYDDLNQVVKEKFRCIRVVKSFFKE